MMTVLPIFLGLPELLSHPVWHFSPFFFVFSLLIVLYIFPRPSLPLSPPSFLPSLTPPSSSPAYISCDVSSDSRDLRTHHSPHSTGTPLLSVCLPACFMGSHDSCILDRGRKWVIAREIKAEKKTTHMYAPSPSLCIPPTCTPSFWLSLDVHEIFSVKVDQNASKQWLVFWILFSEWFIRLCQTSPWWKEMQSWQELEANKGRGPVC